MRVRTDGGSAAAREYGGREGRVTTITPSWDKVSLFVRIQANRNFGTAFEERDLVRLGDDEEVVAPWCWRREPAPIYRLG